jgi:hypothetical protein
MAVQTNFRAADMLGAAKAVETVAVVVPVVEEKVQVAPKAKAVKVEPVVVEEVALADSEDVVEEVAAPVEE